MQARRACTTPRTTAFRRLSRPCWIAGPTSTRGTKTAPLHCGGLPASGVAKRRSSWLTEAPIWRRRPMTAPLPCHAQNTTTTRRWLSSCSITAPDKRRSDITGPHQSARIGEARTTAAASAVVWAARRSVRRLRSRFHVVWQTAASSTSSSALSGIRLRYTRRCEETAMTRIDPVWATAAELSRAYAARELSPVDAVAALLERIRRRDPELHAFIAVYADEARLAAEGADRAIRAGHRVGPLHGVPIALKDLVDMEGRVTTGGSKVWAERV